MAVTPSNLAALLGIAVADADDANDAGIVEAQRLIDIASSLVTKHLRGATDCPDAIVDEAVVRTAGHVQTRTGYGKVDKLEVGKSVKLSMRPSAANPVRQSGAAALLSPWVSRRC